MLLKTEGKPQILPLFSCFSVYKFVLISLHREDTSSLQGYYKQNKSIYIHTLNFALVSLFFIITGIICFLLLLRMYSVCHLLFVSVSKTAYCTAYTFSFVCGSTILARPFIFKYCDSTDPFYVSRIAVYYGIVIFVDYLPSRIQTFYQSYAQKSSLPNPMLVLQLHYTWYDDHFPTLCKHI